MQRLYIPLNLKRRRSFMIKPVGLLLLIHLFIVSQQNHQHIGLQQGLLNLKRLAVLHVILKRLTQVPGTLKKIILQEEVLSHGLLNDRNVSFTHVTFGLETWQGELYFAQLASHATAGFFAKSDLETEKLQEVGSRDAGGLEQDLLDGIDKLAGFGVGALFDGFFEEQ
jgi:hypothetical protein